jgi:hypothetical protein
LYMKSSYAISKISWKYLIFFFQEGIFFIISFVKFPKQLNILICYLTAGDYSWPFILLRRSFMSIWQRTSWSCKHIYWASSFCDFLSNFFIFVMYSWCIALIQIHSILSIFLICNISLWCYNSSRFIINL